MFTKVICPTCSKYTWSGEHSVSDISSIPIDQQCTCSQNGDEKHNKPGIISSVINDKQGMKKREHVVLLGDSILDNENYVKRSYPSVIDQLKDKCGKYGWTATNCAVDGAVLADIIADQIKHIPLDVTTIVISAGGNDGLGALYLMNTWTNWLPWNFIRLLYELKNSLLSQYSLLIRTLQEKFPNANIICCTIYYPVFDDELLIQTVSNIGINVMANMIIHDLSLKQFQSNLSVIDLRYVFSERHDYANSIEPSVCGGDKITNNIMHIVNKSNGNSTFVYKLNEYSHGFNVDNFVNSYWMSNIADQQQGSYATIFFRHAFNERKNTNIKLYAKCSAVFCVGVGVASLCWKYRSIIPWKL